MLTYSDEYDIIGLSREAAWTKASRLSPIFFDLLERWRGWTAPDKIYNLHLRTAEMPGLRRTAALGKVWWKIAEDRTLAFDLCVEAEVLSFFTTDHIYGRRWPDRQEGGL